MKYRIQRIDPTKWAEEIKRIQRLTLPNDKLKGPKYGEWWLVFDPAGKVVGFAILAPSTRYADCAYLARAGVDPAHRGHGLQRRLIRARLRHAKKQGKRWVFTDTYQNPKSANNLISCGFEAFTPKKVWGYVLGNYWRKSL